MGSCLTKPDTNPGILPCSPPQEKPLLPRTRSTSESPTRVSRPGEIRLFGAQFCPFTYRVRIALEFKGIPAHVFWLCTENSKISSKQLLAYMLPDSKLPILLHEDQSISGSSDDILDYVEARFPKPSLLLQTKSFVKWFAFVRDTFSPLMLQAAYEVDPLSQATRQEELHEAFKKIDCEIGKHASKGPYFMGDQFSLVDAYIIPFLLLAKPLSYFHGIDISPLHVHLIDYSKRMMNFSCYAPIRMDMDLLQMHVAKNLAHNGRPPLVVLTVLQHHSILHHLEKLVAAVDELIVNAKQTSRIIDPAKGSIVMQIRKVAMSYGSVLDFMLEHAQMEERVIFPALEKADRGITKVANESHARDLPLMNGIREDFKTVLALRQGNPGKTEILNTVSTRLRALKERTQKHFLEEEVDLLPLLGAAGLGSKQQAAVIGQCVNIMEMMHLQRFPVLLDGLRPHEIHQYVELLQKCSSEECKDFLLKPAISALKQADEYDSVWRVIRERLPDVAALG